MTILQEIASVPNFARTEGTKEEETLSSNEKISPSTSVRPYQPHAPFPQRVAWPKLSKLESRFARFLNLLRRIYVNALFLEALKEAPTYLKFLRELFPKKGNPGDISVAPLGKACSTILQNSSPSKLQDPGNFSIPYCIGDMQIERALCNLGASVSLIPLSPCQKLKLLDLIPTTMSINQQTTPSSSLQVFQRMFQFRWVSSSSHVISLLWIQMRAHKSPLFQGCHFQLLSGDDRRAGWHHVFSVSIHT